MKKQILNDDFKSTFYPNQHFFACKLRKKLMKGKTKPVFIYWLLKHKCRDKTMPGAKSTMRETENQSEKSERKFSRRSRKKAMCFDVNRELLYISTRKSIRSDVMNLKRWTEFFRGVWHLLFIEQNRQYIMKQSYLYVKRGFFHSLIFSINRKISKRGY